jgi:hypothetical protein
VLECFVRVSDTVDVLAEDIVLDADMEKGTVVEGVRVRESVQDGVPVVVNDGELEGLSEGLVTVDNGVAEREGLSRVEDNV